MCLAKEKLNEDSDDNTIPVFPLTLGEKPIKSKTLRSNVSNPDYQSVKENNINVIKNFKATTNTSGSIRSPFTNCDSPLTYSHSTAPISTSESVKTRSMNCQGLSSSNLHQFKLIIIAYKIKFKITKYLSIFVVDNIVTFKYY